MRWGLGLDTPLKQMTRVLEHLGVIVIRFGGDCAKLDAFPDLVYALS